MKYEPKRRSHFCILVRDKRSDEKWLQEKLPWGLIPPWVLEAFPVLKYGVTSGFWTEEWHGRTDVWSLLLAMQLCVRTAKIEQGAYFCGQSINPYENQWLLVWESCQWKWKITWVCMYLKVTTLLILRQVRWNPPGNLVQKPKWYSCSWLTSISGVEEVSMSVRCFCLDSLGSTLPWALHWENQIGRKLFLSR